MKLTINYCDVCGNEHTGSKCTICIIKCPYCDDILGEDAIDCYIVGKCRHLICFEDPNNDDIYWISNEFENRFKFYCEENIDDSKFNPSQEQLLDSSKSEKVPFKQFAHREKFIKVEHELYANDGRRNPVFLYVIQGETNIGKH